MASALMFAVVCRGSRLRVADANRLNKLMHKASEAVGVELDSMTVVTNKRILSKLHAILDNVTYPLHVVLAKHRSMFSAWLKPPKCTIESNVCLWPSNYTPPSLCVSETPVTHWIANQVSNIPTYS